jgi:hypothetical protein
MAESGLHKMDGCPTVQGMGGVSVPQPVAGHFLFNAGPPRRLTDDPPHLGFVQMSALPTSEHRGIVFGIAPQRHQGVPDGFRHQDGASLATFSEHSDLTRRIPALKVAPVQVAHFRDTKPATVKRQQDRTIPGDTFKGDHAKHIRFIEDTLGQTIPKSRESQGAGYIKGEIAQPVSEGEKALHR